MFDEVVSVCFETVRFVSVVSIQVRNTETNRIFQQIMFRFVSVQTVIFCLFLYWSILRLYEVLKGRVRPPDVADFQRGLWWSINHPEFFRTVYLPGISISKNGCLRLLFKKFCFRNSHFFKNKCLNSLKNQTKKLKFCIRGRSTFLGHLPKIIHFENVEKNF